MIREEPEEGPWKFAAKYSCMHVCWFSCNFLLAWVLLLPLLAPHGQWGLNGWHALLLYAPSFTISNHVDRSVDYNAIQTVVRVWFPYSIEFYYSCCLCHTLLILKYRLQREKKP
jgi:hypothetical protein